MPSRTDNQRAKDLRELLLGSVPAEFASSVPSGIAITDLTLDSRAVSPGAAFVALGGARTHGIGFAAQAVSAGAKAILWEPTEGVAAPRLPDGIPLVAVPHLAECLGAIADRFFDAPSQAVRVVGVTGTNGKTTTAHVIAAASQGLGIAAAYSGTIGFGRIDALRPATHTTPDCITIHRQIAALRDDSVRCLGMEVSSHALDQRRVDAVRFDTAVFTNLTHDHLDYHGTFEAYAAAKAKLFTWPGLRHAVINADDAFGRSLLVPGRGFVGLSDVAVTLANPRTHGPAPNVTVYSRDASLATRAGDRARHLFVRRVVAGTNGLEIDVDGSWGEGTLRSRFIGEFNVENLLAVLATLLGWNLTLGDAIAAVEECSAPPGRMETLTVAGKPLVIVDYAHTPDALEKVLLAARKHCAGRLVCVFGCGGDRDPAKRPVMGAIAERLCDRIIITDDNPRTENGAAIVADIVSGLTQPAHATIERDRAAAIALAIGLGSDNDVVVIAGKGHEDYQIVGAQRRHFSDRETALAELGARS